MVGVSQYYLWIDTLAFGHDEFRACKHLMKRTEVSKLGKEVESQAVNDGMINR